MGREGNMLEDLVVEPMTEAFILWRCLHGGPLSGEPIDQWRADSGLPWDSYRKRNLPLLVKLTRVYGACAIVARAGDQAVGLLRFYPKAVWDVAGAGGLCLQQDSPSGPADDFADRDFPPLARIEDKTLVIHCLMTGCARQQEHPYQRKGLGSRMVRTLLEWAKARGWERIEAASFEDLPIIYEITGMPAVPSGRNSDSLSWIAIRTRICGSRASSSRRLKGRRRLPGFLSGVPEISS